MSLAVKEPSRSSGRIPRRILGGEVLRGRILRRILGGEVKE